MPLFTNIFQLKVLTNTDKTILGIRHENNWPQDYINKLRSENSSLPAALLYHEQWCTFPSKLFFWTALLRLYRCLQYNPLQKDPYGNRQILHRIISWESLPLSNWFWFFLSSEWEIFQKCFLHSSAFMAEMAPTAQTLTPQQSNMEEIKSALNRQPF